jgi:cell division protein FtsI (penicillin-binding protein 3)
MRARLIVCAVALAAWTLAVEARLVYLQVYAHSAMQARANGQQLRTITLSAKRGDIYDRNGRLLAYSVDADTIGADPVEVEDPEEVARLVCEALDLQQRAARRAGRAAQQQAVTLRLPGAADLPDTARRVRALALPGVTVYAESRRYYPNKELAAHVLGFVGIDNDGLGGIESRFDERIRGREGQLLVQADGRQRAMSVREERPADGRRGLELTIDRNLQHIAERELRAGVEASGAAAGTAIVMHPQTGDILALANWPTFNPNAIGGATRHPAQPRGAGDLRAGLDLQDRHGLGRARGRRAPARRSHRLRAGLHQVPGRPADSGRARYGALSFTDVIVKSSNVGAIKAGLQLGPERLVRYMAPSGSGSAWRRTSGREPGMVWSPEQLDASALASVSMGYQVSVTPLQMAAAVSAVANGGTLYEPRVVRALIRMASGRGCAEATCAGRSRRRPRRR